MSQRGSHADVSSSPWKEDKILIGIGVFGILVTLVSFFSPEWVVRWERGHSTMPLKSIGLWMIQLEE